MLDGAIRFSRFVLALVLAVILLPLTVSAQVCDCPNVADVNGDGSQNVLDMAQALDILLANAPIVQDPNCPVARADMNADGILDMRDITVLRYYFFLGGTPPIDPCDCETTPSLCDPIVDPTPGGPGNSVVVESKSIVAGASGVPIHISLTNDVALQGLAVPLVAREITPGSFITSAAQSFEDRIDASTFQVEQVNQYADQDGACPGGFGTVSIYASENPSPVGASPEGFLFFGLAIGPGSLGPGTDGTGSLVLRVDVTTTLGQFEIDTTCLDPSTHLLFVQDDPPTSTPIIPSFTKGIIDIVANTGPVALCTYATVSVDNSCGAVDVSVDDGSYDPDGGEVTVTQTPPGPYGLGETVVTLTVEDDAGATSECQATVTVEDTTPPEIVCPDDIYINIPPVYQGWVVAFDVTATDNCPGEVTIDCSHESGTFFPNGQTEVTCTATDASGNTAECSFFVTIDAQCYDRFGDANCDGQMDALDLAILIDVLYAGGEIPPCTNGPQ